MRRFALIPALLTLVSLAAAGCGGGGHKASPTTTTDAASGSAATTTTSALPPPSGPGALQAEANSAAAGDIPDNQVFLVFHNGGAGYSIKYPEGWAQQGAGGSVVFRDKNNIVRIVVVKGAAPTTGVVRNELAHARRIRVESAPTTMTVSGSPAVKAVYSTVSAPNAVTGKRVKLVVDRYYLWRAGRRAVIDLGTPQGVDNVDAYRLMVESFRWR